MVTEGWGEGEGGLRPTVLRVLCLSDAAVRGGPLIVLLRQGEGPETWAPRGGLAAGGLRLVQAAVVEAVGGVLQVLLHRLGGGEGDPPVGVLRAEGRRG